MVIAIISILASLLLPALQNAQAIAQQTVCGNNMKQILLAAQMYSDSNRGWMTVACPRWNGKSPHQWQVELAGELDLSPWSVTSNSLGTVYACPSFDHSLKGTSGHLQFLGGIAINGYFGDLGMYPGSAAEILANVTTDPAALERYRRKKRSEVNKPSQTVMIADGRDNGGGSGGPGHQMGFVMHGGTELRRHSNGSLNVGWIDGHVSKKDWVDSLQSNLKIKQ
ncbi:MAG: hypothetical protein ACYTGH_12020 [Planctomycetota bacterium]